MFERNPNLHNQSPILLPNQPSSRSDLTSGPSSDGWQKLFVAPLCEWTEENIFRYYRTRQSVHYFPVIDEVETARSKIDHVLQDRFEFNHHTYHLPPPLPWTTNPSRDREWLILLHKFYFAVGLGMAFEQTKNRAYCRKWVELTSSWIDSVPLDFLPSDVVGRRVQNWIFSHYYFVHSQAAPDLNPEFYGKFLTSLSNQVDFLCAHLSPARNHRTLELCAIFLAGVVFPEFRRARYWVDFARIELIRNIQTDLLPDGVHCELSTDYHHLVLKNYLWIRRLAALNHFVFPPLFDDQIQKALEFSLYVHKPDGTIPALSDGDSRNFLNLLEQGYQLYGKPDLHFVALKGREGTAPTARSVGFPNSGYYILRSGWGGDERRFEEELYLVFDCGPLGAGNHGHLDLLNFEMAAYGQSLIVDPGRFTYDESGPVNWRVRFRETAAHNTILVDQTNQTRYRFDTTRYKIKGPEPDHELRRFETRPDFDFLHGVARSHEYPVIHERMIAFVAPHYWIVTDHLTAHEPHAYDLRFHLSSMAQGKVHIDRQPSAVHIQSPHLLLVHLFENPTDCVLEEGFVSQSYGVKSPAPVIRFSRNAVHTTFHTILIPFRIDPPVLSATLRSVYQSAAGSSNAIGSELALVLSRGSRTWLDTYRVTRTPDMDAAGEQASVHFTRTRETGTVLKIHTL